MKRKRRMLGRRVLECSAVLAAGVFTAPTSAAEEPTEVDQQEPRFEQSASRALSGLDRTYLLCRAATSPVEAIRFAAARSLARPLHAVGEELALVHLLSDSSKRVRLAAQRAASARGFSLSPTPNPSSDSKG